MFIGERDKVGGEDKMNRTLESFCQQITFFVNLRSNIGRFPWKIVFKHQFCQRKMKEQRLLLFPFCCKRLGRCLEWTAAA
jgi:hypothetical protein